MDWDNNGVLSLLLELCGVFCLVLFYVVFHWKKHTPVLRFHRVEGPAVFSVLIFPKPPKPRCSHLSTLQNKIEFEAVN